MSGGAWVIVGIVLFILGVLAWMILIRIIGR